METGLEGKPWFYGAGTGIFLAAVMVVGAYFVAIKGMDRQIFRQERQYAELEEQVQEGRAAQRQLPQFLERVKALELELDKLLRILPSRRKTEDILRRVRALTEQGDFELMRFDPSSPAQLDDFYSEWRIDIELQGTFHNLALFFDRISRFSRIINIQQLSVNPVRASPRGHTIRAIFQAKTFLANEPPPALEEEAL